MNDSRRLKWIAGIGIAGFIAAVTYYGLFEKETQLQKAAWEQHDAQVAELDARLKKLATEIKKLQGHGECKSDAQCRIRGLGAQICGQAGNYIVYSTVDADEPALLDAVADFTRTHAKLTDLTLSVNVCGYHAAPVHCIRNECVGGR